MTVRVNCNILSGGARLQEVLLSKGFRNVGVVVDSNLKRECLPVRELLLELESDFRIFEQEYSYKFEPSYQYLDEVMFGIRSKKLDQEIEVWVGIGGGSTLDTAKGLAILCRNTGPSLAYRGFPEKLNQPLPVIAIPSTAGSGSDVSFNASFIDEDTKTKMGINYLENYPIASILDPMFVRAAPRSVLVSSGIDALVHTLESFVSRKSTAVSRFFSTKAFHLIAKNLPLLLSNHESDQTWSNMQWAAIFAMWGLSNSTSGPAGALSYYLGTHYLVRHGIAGGVFIGKITRLNHEHGYHNYADLFGWSDDHDLGMTKRDKSEIVVQLVEGLLQEGEIPASLKALGIGQGDKKGFVDFAQEAKGAFDLNPVQFSNKDLDRIFL